MNYIKFSLTLFIVAVLSGCSNKGNELGRVQLYNLSNVSNTNIVDLNPIVEEVEEIPLDTRSFAPTIGTITYLQESENYFYIVSDDMHVYQYNKRGNFIKQIGTNGRGANSYSEISGFAISDNGEIITVYDQKNNKILRYSESNRRLSTEYPAFKDSTLYIDSFFPYKANNVIFYTSNNSIRMDLINYNSQTKKREIISRHEREREKGEGNAGRVYSFGNRNNPLVYNYFNDTVYMVGDAGLVPQFLIETGRMKYEFDNYIFDRDRNPRKSVSGSKITISNIIKGGRYIFINYKISGMLNSFPPDLLALYNTESKQAIQHVLLEDTETEYRSISGESTLFQAKDPNTIIKIRYPYLTVNLNPVIIKYKLK